MTAPQLRCEPATAANWPQLQALFGKSGACGGCWCMTMRLNAREFEAGKGAANQAALRRLVESDLAPGLLGLLGDDPVGWISVGPRPDFARLAGSRILAAVDAQPVWSIACLFVRKDRRNLGLSSALLLGACSFAAAHGAALIEGYPHEPDGGPMPPAFAWTGIASAFRKAGFLEAARRSPKRPIFRKDLRKA